MMCSSFHFSDFHHPDVMIRIEPNAPMNLFVKPDPAAAMPPCFSSPLMGKSGSAVLPCLALDMYHK
jgi:hypothetical protein